MDRCCWLGSRLFGCLAVTLMVLAALAVPDRFALADSGGFDCSGYCSSNYGSGTPQYYDCLNQCQTCDGNCAQQYGEGTIDYYNCMDQCFQGFLGWATNCPPPLLSNTCALKETNTTKLCRNSACANNKVACDCIGDPDNGIACSCP
jgi:hypothetical protein